MSSTRRPLLWMATLLTLALTSLPALALADQPTINEVEKDGVKGLKATFTVEQPRDVVFATIDDLDAFLKLFPDIKEYKVLQHEGNSRDVYFKVDAVLAEAEYVLRRTARRSKLADSISWERLRGDANVIRGSWVLVDGDKPGTTRVTYQSYVDVSAVVPTAMVRDVAIGKVNEMVDRLRGACDHRAAAKP